MKYKLLLLTLAGFLFIPGFDPCLNADTGEQINVTVIVASNDGSDFDLDNDAYRDQMIQLFSYSSYKQLQQKALGLKRAVRSKMDLPGGYELILTWQGEEAGRYLVQAIIRKHKAQYVDTVLSILKPGVVFLGGPSVNGGDLILVLEMGF